MYAEIVEISSLDITIEAIGKFPVSIQCFIDAYRDDKTLQSIHDSYDKQI